METHALFTSTPEHTEFNLMIGTIAFLLTVVQVLMVFRIFFSMTLQNQAPASVFLLLSFVLGASTHTSWLVYTWPSGDLFIKISTSLWTVMYLILIVQTLVIARYKST